MKREIHSVGLLIAKRLVKRLHRHSHKLPCGHLFSLALVCDGEIRGVAMVGRPVARRLDDGSTAEVTRLATDGVQSGCSQLYAACVRMARKAGYSRVVTYTRTDESGTSLRAAGWVATPMHTKPRQWNQPSRPREHDPDACGRIRWEAPPTKARPQRKGELQQVTLL